MTDVKIAKIISGGQSGADRAGLDAAITRGIPHGGWCPKGRKAEDGRIGGQYCLAETPSGGYAQRTRWNVRDSDGTVVFTRAPVVTGGSRLTIAAARKLGRPYVHITPGDGGHEAPALVLRRFLGENKIAVLNVAGSRESKEPGIYLWSLSVLNDALSRSSDRPDMPGGLGEG